MCVLFGAVFEELVLLARALQPKSFNSILIILFDINGLKMPILHQLLR